MALSDHRNTSVLSSEPASSLQPIASSGPQQKLDLLTRSLRMLQERHGARFGIGAKVELWHALGDLESLVDEIATELSRGGAG